MDAAALRAMQAPIKERYKGDPDAAMITLKAKGTLDDTNIACKVETGRALAVAGLHPATGGSGHGAVLRRHAARGAGRLRRRDAEGGRRPRSTSRSSPARSRPKAISIFAARSASPRMRRSASRRSACASTSTPTRRRRSSTSCSSSPSAIAWCTRPSRAGPPVEVSSSMLRREARFLRAVTAWVRAQRAVEGRRVTGGMPSRPDVARAPG